jgi:transcriptional regulator with XRE-family HTH domain
MPYSKGYRPSLKALGATISACRLKLRRSQADVAKALRMSQASLSHIERGADTRLSTFVDLAREVGLEPVLVPKALVSVVRDIAAHAEAQRTTDAPITRKFS